MAGLKQAAEKDDSGSRLRTAFLLDSQFAKVALAVQQRLHLYNRHTCVRIKAWLTRLSEPTSNATWKKVRNRHVCLLLFQLRCEGRLLEPFCSSPPTGPLENILPHCLAPMLAEQRSSAGKTMTLSSNNSSSSSTRQVTRAPTYMDRVTPTRKPATCSNCGCTLDSAAMATRHKYPRPECSICSVLHEDPSTSLRSLLQSTSQSTDSEAPINRRLFDDGLRDDDEDVTRDSAPSPTDREGWNWWKKEQTDVNAAFDWKEAELQHKLLECQRVLNRRGSPVQAADDVNHLRQLTANLAASWHLQQENSDPLGIFSDLKTSYTPRVPSPRTPHKFDHDKVSPWERHTQSSTRHQVGSGVDGDSLLVEDNSGFESKLRSMRETTSTLRRNLNQIGTVPRVR